MTHSGLTNQIALTPNQYSTRGGRRVTNIVLHHTASTSGHGNGVVNMMVSGSRQVSAHYVVGSDGWAWLVVDEDYRAWSLSSANADGRSIVMECVNSTGAPEWGQSEASYEKIAQLVADICRRYNLPINRNTVVGHREVQESYSTACPGGMDLNRIVNRANQIAGSGYTVPAGTGGGSAPATDENSKLSREDVRRIATYLNGRGLGKTTSANEDGLAGPIYVWLIQTAAQKDNLYAGFDIDGLYGNKTRELEEHYGRVSAGVPFTPPTSPAQAPAAPQQASASWAFNLPSQGTQARVQRGLTGKGRYGGPADGRFGINSIKGIQTTIRNVGYTGDVDGIAGEMTCYYIQVYAARFGDYSGPQDKILGENSWNGFALGLERP